MPSGTGWGVRGVIGSTPPQASGDAASATRPVTALVCPTGVGAAPTGISAIGSVPVFRVLKYRVHESVSVASTMLWASLPPNRNTHTSAL